MPPLKTIIDTWIFDLDNTLYSADSGIFQQVGELMSKFVSNHLNIEYYLDQKPMYQLFY